MKRKELDELKRRIKNNADKACDMDIVLSQMMKLPFGQLKKLLTDEVLAVLEKYGYTGET